LATTPLRSCSSTKFIDQEREELEKKIIKTPYLSASTTKLAFEHKLKKQKKSINKTKKIAHEFILRTVAKW
jgi:hypothetical protein